MVLNYEKTVNIKKEETVLDSTTSTSDKKKSSPSTSLGESKMENKVSSKSRSDRKNLQQSYTADTDTKADVCKEEKESVTSDKIEVSFKKEGISHYYRRRTRYCLWPL